MGEQSSLALFTKAAVMLAEADTIQKAKELKDLALTAADWAKRKGMGSYDDFIASKRQTVQACGFDVRPEDINPILFPFQKDLVRWAVRKGRAAIFAECGLGKTLMQLEWARLIGDQGIIVAPLSVARQTVREGKKLGIAVHYTRSDADLVDGINITNYEMIEHFDPDMFRWVILDESSLIKCAAAKTRTKLIKMFTDTPYRLCCTATPAPNDHIELGNHAEFLGICAESEMRAMFFINANKEHTFTHEGVTYTKKGSNKNGTEWRLKHAAEEPFFQWLASWAITLTKPSDLGYSDEGFVLPPLEIVSHSVEATGSPEGQLFFTHLHGIGDRAKVRRQTLEVRLAKLRELIANDSDQWIVWVGLDDEGRAATQAITDAVEVKGSDTSEYKAQMFEAFQDGKFKVLVSKVKIAGFGLNMQCAHKMAFLGLSDSWEGWYQAIRRQWRFKQEHSVTVHIILSDHEEEIYANIQRKDAMAARLRQGLIDQIKNYEKEELTMGERTIDDAEKATISTEYFTAMQGDSCERLKELGTDSVDLSVYSPPFSSLFTYTATPRDLGNCRTDMEFFNHYRFIIREVLRVTKPGRLTCVHTSDIPAMMERDGYIGIKDFPGDVIRAYEAEGWIFYGRAFVQKNPQALRDGTPVLTPLGWKPIDALRIGQLVIGANGKSTAITDIPYHGLQPIYRVTLDDGSWVDCSPEHLWTVRTSDKNGWQTMTTTDLFSKGVLRPNGGLRYEIPVLPAPSLDPAPVPMPPRLLGALLADGSWSHQRCVSITKDKELVESLPLPQGHSLALRPNRERAHGRTTTYGIVGPAWHKNAVLQSLRDLGLEDCRAWEKFIPSVYLTAGVSVRRELLRGLLDGDGKIQAKGGIYYSTTSPQLAEDVRQLVNSLGGLATVRQREGGHFGDDKQGRPIYEISIRLNGDWCPFTLQRKAKYWRDDRRAITRRIASIEPTGETAPCTCISVEAEDGLYVTKDHIVTHNSQAIRVKSKALLFVQLRKDSADSRPALVDQILIFQKPGENAVPITPVANGEMDNETWIEWAHGIWLGIRETETLQAAAGRDDTAEKHICPLQLGTIERCIKLYSNPGETILTPFMGIGSEIYQSIRFGRKGIGIELNPSYFSAAVKNLNRAVYESTRGTLFDFATEQTEAV